METTWKRTIPFASLRPGMKFAVSADTVAEVVSLEAVEKFNGQKHPFVALPWCYCTIIVRHDGRERPFGQFADCYVHVLEEEDEETEFDDEAGMRHALEIAEVNHRPKLKIPKSTFVLPAGKSPKAKKGIKIPKANRVQQVNDRLTSAFRIPRRK